jgi:hypothetical protein
MPQTAQDRAVDVDGGAVERVEVERRKNSPTTLMVAVVCGFWWEEE